MTAFKAITRDITVEVTPYFIEDQSDANLPRYVWAYHVQIHNHSQMTVQLINRHWKITDGRGRLEEVKGDGVVGQQPTLVPGESYHYTSGCPLSTPSGIMEGEYGMRNLLNGEDFPIKIPAFSLDCPWDTQPLN